MMRKALFGVLGLLFWLATQWIALGIAAGGHGWLSPLWLSMPLVVLYPVAFVRAFCVTTGPPWLDQDLLVIAGVLDLLVLRSIFIEQERIIQAWNIYTDNRYVMALWLALWFGWQLLCLATLIRRRHLQIDAESP